MSFKAILSILGLLLFVASIESNLLRTRCRGPITGNGCPPSKEGISVGDLISVTYNQNESIPIAQHAPNFVKTVFGAVELTEERGEVLLRLQGDAHFSDSISADVLGGRIGWTYDAIFEPVK